MYQAILTKEFYHEGRGPELQKVYYTTSGTILLAIDFYNPDDVHSEEFIKHVLFIKPQAFMVTPEEEYRHTDSSPDYSKTDRGALVNLGTSSWYQSFSHTRSLNCSHFQLKFYDQYVDIICEDIQIKKGSFAGYGIN